MNNITVSFWQRLRRTPYQSVGAVFMIFVTIFVTAIFLLAALGSSSLLSYLESKPQLTVFFKDEKDKTSIDGLMQKLKSTGKTSNISFISKEQALAIYKQQNKNDPLLLEMVTADILPASLEVSAVSPKYLFELSEIVKKEQGIDEVIYQKDVVDTLISWTNTVRKIGSIFIIFLVISTLFIILTSIGMKIAYRKEEIEILKLVGATTWFIKKPFIQEGIIYGLLGSNIAWVCVSLLFLYLHPYIASFLKGIPSLELLKFQQIVIYVFPPNIVFIAILWLTLTIMGIIIGLVGSIFATSRFVRS
jgi:cell division transport system permease protein